MAKAAAKKPPAKGEAITVTYDLFDLPTAQHKAGLAGLILMLRWMEKQHRQDEEKRERLVPKITELTPTAATITFTEDSVQGLFDAIYSAKTVEVLVKSKWANATESRPDVFVDETDDKGNVKKVRRFAYEVTQPTGALLETAWPDENDPRLKLWREMLWAVPRGNPNTRIPYEQCAAGLHCKEGAVAWAELEKYRKARAKNVFYTAEVASALWLGAQANNAEQVPFEGRVEQTLLLHCWVFTSLIYVPQRIDRDGKSEYAGYVLAIPEVSDLEAFCEDFPTMLAKLEPKLAGYRPAAALVDLPAQGALSFCEHLSRVITAKDAKKPITAYLSAVEYVHLVKIGNNIKSHGSGRVEPDARMLQRYQLIVGTPDQPPAYKNPLFRRGLLQALLEGRPWHEPMAAIMQLYDAPFFCRGEATPRTMPLFATDAKTKFDELYANHTHRLEAGIAMPETDDDKLSAFALTVHKMVRAYLNERAKDKSGIDPDTFKKDGRIDWDAMPEEYAKVRQKLGLSLILEFRPRREQAFIDHFTGTFCSVKQYLRDEDMAAVSVKLLREHETVKTITLLALSANS